MNPFVVGVIMFYLPVKHRIGNKDFILVTSITSFVCWGYGNRVVVVAAGKQCGSVVDHPNTQTTN